MSDQQENKKEEKSGLVYSITDRLCQILWWIWVTFITGICIAYLATLGTVDDPITSVRKLYGLMIGPVQIGLTVLVLLITLFVISLVSWFLRDRFKPAPNKSVLDAILESIQKLMQEEEEWVKQETDPLKDALALQRTMAQEQQKTSEQLTQMVEHQSLVTQQQQNISHLLTQLVDQQGTLTQKQQSTSELLTEILKEQRTMTQKQQSTATLLSQILEQIKVTVIQSRTQRDTEPQNVLVLDRGESLADTLSVQEMQQ